MAPETINSLGKQVTEPTKPDNSSLLANLNIALFESYPIGKIIAGCIDRLNGLSLEKKEECQPKS
ncbi:MAG: hypothetical protein Q7R31_00425 [Candidatus Levybacteria bacterium]|nr:hypothetical protein [Candidatus Levybacteria bacterium]